MERFRANVHYGDFEGTAAADRADIVATVRTDQGDISQFLWQTDGFVLAVEMSHGEERTGSRGHTHVRVLTLPGAGSKDHAAEILRASPGPVQVNAIELDVTLEDFVRLFKRFAVTLTPRDLGLVDREYEIIG